MAKEAQNNTPEGSVSPLPHIDISSPEAAKKTLFDYRRWFERTSAGDFWNEQLRQVEYVECVIDAARFKAFHKSEAMKQGAQEAIEKLKAMLTIG